MRTVQTLLPRCVLNMAYEYVLLRSAQTEYSNIVKYLVDVSDGLQAASNFVDEFDRQIAIVCDNPFIHAVSRMPELAARGYRIFFVNRYVVLYKFEGDLVIVAHIFHQTQNYARLV